MCKAHVTTQWHKRIIEAIYKYQVNYKKQYGKLDESVSYDIMEPTTKTFHRFYDWSYKRIVPKDVLNKIKKYL